MDIVDSIRETNKKATNLGEKYLKTSYEYYKLKIFQQLSISVGMFFKVILIGTLLVIGVGLPIIFQATINMAVATNLFPVTGQTLPLISSGGTSIWMTCFALGMILSVSASKQETEEDILDDNPLDILHETID